MARGQQKIQSQQKAAEKAAKAKKQAGHSAKDAAKTAAAGLKASCSVCKVRIFPLYFCQGQLLRDTAIEECLLLCAE